MQTYSTYEAKARFSEILRRVRAGERIVITYRGDEVAEIRPYDREATTVQERLDSLEQRGIIGPRKRPGPALEPLQHVPGGLERFLGDRD